MIREIKAGDVIRIKNLLSEHIIYRLSGELVEVSGVNFINGEPVYICDHNVEGIVAVHCDNVGSSFSQWEMSVKDYINNNITDSMGASGINDFISNYPAEFLNIARIALKELNELGSLTAYEFDNE